MHNGAYLLRYLIKATLAQVMSQHLHRMPLSSTRTEGE